MTAASFDSNILIDALNGRSAAQDELESCHDRWISRLTWIEVLSKVDSRTRPATEALLTGFFIDEVTLPISERAAELRNERPKLKLPDAVIHASALLGNRPLVTRNTRDFPIGMPGIRVPYTLHG